MVYRGSAMFLSDLAEPDLADRRPNGAPNMQTTGRTRDSQNNFAGLANGVQGRVCDPLVVAATIYVALLVPAPTEAQTHGVRVGNSCARSACIGETMSCELFVMHADGFGDVIEIVAAWEAIDPEGAPVRVPSVGNLTIVHIDGNTTCAAGGSLPCSICAGGSSCDGGPPSSLEPGVVIFGENSYEAQRDAPSPLSALAGLQFREHCETPNESGCSPVLVTVQAATATNIPSCDDGDACTMDTCGEGRCENLPIVCDDEIACTIDFCDPLDGCLHEPVPCPPGETCVAGSCTLGACNMDGQCGPGEDCTTCPADCSSIEPGCGNGICELSLGETCLSCSADCNGLLTGKAGAWFCCGVATGKYETGCGDLRCRTSGFSCTFETVGACCGDSVCDAFESGCNCEVDCGLATGHETPGAVCADGIDNDCDALIDRADPDCACGAAGARCASNDDCCSGRCARRGLCQ